MTTTNAELIATATAFKAAMSDANTDAPAPGSILDLWLRTADALEAATTIAEHMPRLTNKEALVRYPEFNLDGNRTWNATERRLAFMDGARWATVTMSNPEEAS